MKKQRIIGNIMITDQNHGIVYMDSSLLSFLSKKNTAPIGYRSGVLRPHDLVVFVERDNNKQNWLRNQMILSQIGIVCNIRQFSTFIAVGIIGEAGVQGIWKALNLPEKGCSLYLDTVYRGKEIKVHLLEEGSTAINIDDIFLYFDGAEKKSQVKSYSDHIVALDHEGVKFFMDNKEESRQIDYFALFSQMPFSSYVNLPLPQVPHYPVEQMLDEKIAQKCFSLGEGDAELIYINQEYLHVVKASLRYAGEVFWIYRYNRFADLVADITEGQKILEAMEVRGRQRQMKQEAFTSFKILGNDEKIQSVKYLLNKVSYTDTRVLITGESGTGKTFLAREIHGESKRKGKPFVHVNCASIPHTLIESELFGYVEGAFTGALKGGKKGLFELAHQGTIFLDEISELPIELQGRLLEVIQNKTFYKVGGSEKIAVNVRLITATNKDLKELISQRRFREDLYYRINVFCIELPPIRARKEDLEVIVKNLLPRVCERMGIEPLQISTGALSKLKIYDWPGNIREIENILEKAAVLCGGKAILEEDLLLPELNLIAMDRSELGFKERKEAFEKQLIEEALAKFRGSRQATANFLKIGRTTLFEKMAKYGIEGEEL